MAIGTAYNTTLDGIYEVTSKISADGFNDDLEGALEKAYTTINLKLRKYESVPVTNSTKVADLKHIEDLIGGGYFKEWHYELPESKAEMSPDRKNGLALLDDYIEGNHTITEAVQDTPVIHYRSSRKM